MPEVANCPGCGEKPFPYHYDEHIAYAHCGVKCDTLEIWNRYAAAMEFTRWVSKQHHGFSRTLSKIIKKANEVFK